MFKYNEESDTDFWIDYDQLIPPKVLNYGQDIIDPIQNLLEKKDVRIQDSEWLHSFYQEKMSRVRESKEIEVSVSTIKARNQTKKRYTSTIENLENKYKQYIQQAQQDFIKFRDALTKKDSFIRDLLELIGEIGLYFSESTIKSLKKTRFKEKEEEEKVQEKVQENGNFEVLAQEIQKQQMQISNLKDICHLYQQDADKANKKAHFYQTEFEKMDAGYKMEIEKLIETNEKQQKINEAEKIEMLKGFDIKVDEFHKEILALELIQTRQQEFINQLQEEIRCAKEVLQSRSMRNKYFDKLKEYKEEMEKIESRKIIPSQPLAENTNSVARIRGKSSTKSITENQLSKSYAKRSHSIRSSQNLPVFTRKIFTSRSNCMEIRAHSMTPGV